MTVEAAPTSVMTSCLPGADSGGSQGSAGLASLNDSVGGSVNASPVLSPNETASATSNVASVLGSNGGLSFR